MKKIDKKEDRMLLESGNRSENISSKGIGGGGGGRRGYGGVVWQIYG